MYSFQKELRIHHILLHEINLTISFDDIVLP